MGCFGFGSRVKKDEDLLFTNFVLRVDVTNGGWEKTVAKVLKKTKDVANFRMYDQHVQVSGMVDPVLLLKQLGKSGNEVEIVHWKFGRCNLNLHMPEFQQRLAYQDYGRRYGNAQYYPFQNRTTHSHQCY